jgi:nicotinate-nucleotide pyrophosphorylase (carboxylating)
MPRDIGQIDRLVRRLRWDELDPVWLRQLIERAREEDLNGGGLAQAPKQKGDATAAFISSRKLGRAKLIARTPTVVAGLRLITPIFAAYGNHCSAKLHTQDKDFVQAGQVIAEVEGPAVELLTSERTLLNFLQHLCGVATWTHQHVTALGDSSARLLDTRKTTPGFRVLEKYAVGAGGGWNHRIGLFDRVMLKDNHLAAEESGSGKSLGDLVRKARAGRPDLLVEVEVDNAAQIDPVLEAGADIVLLDNFSLADLKVCVPEVKKLAWCEVSGGVSMQHLPEIGCMAPDFVSCGILTHGAGWADIGLDWD